MGPNRGACGVAALARAAGPGGALRLACAPIRAQRGFDFCRPRSDADNAVKAGEFGVEIKTTRKAGGAVDTHGARDQWMCVFVYAIDVATEPAIERRAMQFTEIYLGQVHVDDFRKNARGELGTRTATLHAAGIAKLRQNWIYRA